jgi:hypothetical protein
MSKQTDEFAKHLDRILSDELFERIVRDMIIEVAKDCPKLLALQLGRVILSYRLEEMK